MSRCQQARDDAVAAVRGTEERLAIIRGRLFRNAISPGDALLKMQQAWAAAIDAVDSALARYNPPMTPAGNVEVHKHQATREALRDQLRLAVCDLFATPPES